MDLFLLPSAPTRMGGGFPAHAGMDPYDSGDADVMPPMGFPAHAGMDPPIETSPASKLQLVSPPTRGWTADIAGGERERVGFPAHAGMDPLRKRARARC